MAPHSPQSSFSSSFSPQSSFSVQSTPGRCTPLTSPSPSPQPENHTPTLLTEQAHVSPQPQTVSNLQELNEKESEEEVKDLLSSSIDASLEQVTFANESDGQNSSAVSVSPRSDVCAQLPIKLTQLVHSASLPELPPMSTSLPTSPDAFIPREVIPVALLEESFIPPPPPPTPQPHPLCHTWVMWFDKMTTGRPQFADYAASLNKLCSIKSVEDFWGVYNNIVPPSDLDKNSNYHFFKKGIRPMWEDPANKHGGKWVLTVKNNVVRLNQLWLELLMALVGEQIDSSHLITGAVMSRRKKGDRIALWTRSKQNREGNLLICKEVLRIVALALNVHEREFSKMASDLAVERDGMSLVYMHHNDSLRTGTSYQNEAHISLKDSLKDILSSVRWH